MIGVQQGLTTIFDLQSTSHTAIGCFGEEWLAQRLQARGYLVSIVHAEGDLKVITPDGEILYIEVKTSRVNDRGKYCFTLYKQAKSGKVKADHRTADFIALLCIMPHGSIVPFIVNTDELRGSKSACITSNPRTYHGKLAQFRQSPNRLTIQ